MENVLNVKMKNHPAKYTNSLLPIFQEIIDKYNCEKILDCFAGTGKVHHLNCKTIGLELEEEWANQSKGTIIGDATNMPFKDNEFCGVCTSPTYGNRMADSHNAKDDSKRNTYTHKLGRELKVNNSGKMQWGESYRDIHRLAWKECYRVMKKDGIFILNFKNHIRKGKEVDVFGWHIKELINLNFILREVKQVPVKGNGFGENGNSRVPFEYVAVLQKGE